MEMFFMTIIFLGFCVTVVAVTSGHAQISALAIRVLGKLSKAEPPHVKQKDDSPQR